MTYKEMTDAILSIPDQNIDNDMFVIKSTHEAVKSGMNYVKETIEKGVDPRKDFICSHYKHVAFRITQELNIKL